MTMINEDLESAAAVQSLIDALVESQPQKGPTGVQRKAKHLEAISETDIDHLLSLDDKFKAAIDIITANQIDLDNLGTLTPEQLVSLMTEYLNEKDLKEVLEVRYKMIRAAIFAHLDEVLLAKGAEDPSHTPGEIAVQEHGRKFVRQGGRAKAKLDESALIEALGPELSQQVFKTTIVPARVVTELDEDALLALVAENPTLLDAFRASIVPGGNTPVSFHVRNL